MTAVPGTTADAASVHGADWVFAGPGSPSYALRHWRGGPIAQALHDRIRSATGVTVLASTAAATIGRASVPVYEIYKAGEPPHRLDGLDLLGVLGLNVAVGPHFDNTEGGTYDTRFCYLGEPRLLAMEGLLPDGVSVLGVDEHTALLVELSTMECEVVGKGRVTVRHAGAVSTLPAGTAMSVADLLAVRSGHAIARVPRPRNGHARPGTAAPTPRDAVAAAEARFAAAAGPDDRAAAVLALEAAIHEWATDTDEDDGVEQARAVLRGLIVRLAGPSAVSAALVEALLAVRRELRAGGAFGVADAIRDALADEGVQVNDTADGATWTTR